MPSLIDEAFRASQEVLTSVFGEAVELLPMAGGDYSAVPDTTRPPLQVTASIMTQIEAANLKGQQTGAGSEFQGSSRIETDDPQIWIDGPTASALPWSPRRGDIVRALEKPGIPEFTIVVPKVGDKGDLLLILTRGSAKRGSRR